MNTKALKTKFVLVALVLVVLASAAFGVVKHASTARAQYTGQMKELKGVGVCFECHEPEQTIGFHYPDRVMAIEEGKDMRRRICVDCHGPGGNDPDRQMTDPRDIRWVEDGSYFWVEPDSIHAIHGKKIEIGALECQTCHQIKDNDPTQLGEFPVLPQPNPGQVLVCQICHLPSDQGNYITIHITSGQQVCATCHTGDLKEIHKRATTELGQIF